jgi:hypothetical protein
MPSLQEKILAGGFKPIVVALNAEGRQLNRMYPIVNTADLAIRIQ